MMMKPFSAALHLIELKLKPVRLLGVSVSSLSTGAQLSLFSGEESSASRITQAMDAINRKYSHGTITRGRTLPSPEEGPRH